MKVRSSVSNLPVPTRKNIQTCFKRLVCSWEGIFVFKTGGRNEEEDFALALGTFKKHDTAVSLIKKVNYTCCDLKSRSLCQFVLLVPLSRIQFPMAH